MELQVKGMSCGGCVKSVTKIISKHTELEPTQILVNLETGLAQFESGAQFKPDELLAALGKAGFEATQN